MDDFEFAAQIFEKMRRRAIGAAKRCVGQRRAESGCAGKRRGVRRRQRGAV